VPRGQAGRQLAGAQGLGACGPDPKAGQRHRGPGVAVQGLGGGRGAAATVWSPPPSPAASPSRSSSSTASRAGTVTLSAARAGSGGSGGDDLPSSSTRQQQQEHEHEDTADTPQVLTWLAYALCLLNIIVMVVYSILLCELRANCPKIMFHDLFRLKKILYEL